MLDPEDHSNVGDWNPPWGSDPRLRDGGQSSNDASPWLGDLLLCSPKQPDTVSRIVIKFQKKYYTPEHAQWTHAAVYIGDGQVCEAVGDGVRAVSIDRYVGGHLLRFRRDPLLTPDERFRLVKAALMRLRKPYTIGEFSQQLSPRFPWVTSRYYVVSPRNVTCGTFYHDAYVDACLRNLWTRACEGDLPLVPAFLSLTARLTDVEVTGSTLCDFPAV